MIPEPESICPEYKAFYGKNVIQSCRIREVAAAFYAQGRTRKYFGCRRMRPARRVGEKSLPNSIRAGLRKGSSRLCRRMRPARRVGEKSLPNSIRAGLRKGSSRLCRRMRPARRVGEKSLPNSIRAGLCKGSCCLWHQTHPVRRVGSVIDERRRKKEADS